MSAFGGATVWAKIAVVLIVIAFGLEIGGFATMYWSQTETIQEDIVFTLGLWKALNCSGGHDSACNDIDVPESYKTGSFKATQALQAILLVMLFVIVVVFIIYVASEKFREMSVAIFITVMCFLVVTFGILSMIIWLASMSSNHYPGYSFGLCVFAFLMTFLAGVLMIPDIRNFSKRDKHTLQKVNPSPRPQYQSKRQPKYDQINYDHSYNRKFTPTPTPPLHQEKVRHYYNPDRDPYVARSPPPSYRTKASFPEFRSDRSTRTEVQTPDVYLGRDAKHPRRY